MASRERKRLGLGVDLGSASFKSVVLALQDGVPVLVRCHRLSTREEGILNEADLYATVASWLKQTDCLGLPIAVGLPQFLSTTQIIDFPPGTDAAALDEMVAYETHQLAGLSDDSFVHDYYVLPAGFGRRNPVLIGICRESVVRDRLTALLQAGIAGPHLAMGGLAALNCLLHLHGEAVSGEDPVLLVDIGRENSTAIILAGGQPLFVSSLLFGGDRFLKAVMEREGLAEAAAEARLFAVDVNEESPRSPLTLAARKLLAEMQDAVSHWRAQERPELNERPLAGIWLCGGAAQLGGIDTYLADDMHCPVQVFGPRDPQSGRILPDMAVACGLALQALKAARVGLSLTPADVRDELHRQRRFGVLVAACGLAVALVAGVMARAYAAARNDLGVLGAEMVELEACEQMIPRVEEARRAIARYEAGLVPLVAAGNRGRHIVEAVDALAAVCGGRDWFVYLGDEGSYQRRAEAVPGNAPTRPAPAGAFPGGDVRPVVGATVLAPEFPSRMLARQAGGVPSLIAAGYTPHQRDQRWEAIRGMIDTLRRRGPYRDVDLVREVEREVRRDIFAPWVQYLVAQPGGLFTPFSIRLTLAEPDTVQPASPEAGASR